MDSTSFFPLHYLVLGLGFFFGWLLGVVLWGWGFLGGVLGGGGVGWCFAGLEMLYASN